MSYRPEGFDSEKIVNDVLTGDFSSGLSSSQALVEAGADAMLEGLLKEPLRRVEGQRYRVISIPE